jgi:hypothetical protein
VASFKVMRRHILKALNWQGYGEAETQRVQDVMHDQTRTLLEGLVAQRDR